MENQRIAVMRVCGLPARLRAKVESLLVAVVKSEPFMAIEGTDVFDLAACTRWRKSSDRSGRIDCREVINGSDDELELLRSQLRMIAEANECVACVDVVR